MRARATAHSAPYSEDLIKDFNTICGGPDPVAVDTICEALMDWDYPGTNVPSTVLGAAEGLGTNQMDEIELTGRAGRKGEAPVPRQNTILQGQYPEREGGHGLDLRSRLPGDRPHPAGSAEGRRHARPTQAPAVHLHRPAVRTDDQPRRWRCDRGRRLRQSRCSNDSPTRSIGARCEEYPELHADLGERPDVGIATYVRQLLEVRDEATSR